MYARQMDGSWREVVGNTHFAPDVFQTPESLTEDQRAKFGLFLIVEMPRPELIATQKLGEPTYTINGATVERSYPAVGKTVDELEADRIAAIPHSVSPRQIRQAMSRVPYGDGTLRGAVEAAVSMGDQDTKDWYEFSTMFERANPQVVGMGVALGVTERQLDDLWTLAGTL